MHRQDVVCKILGGLRQSRTLCHTIGHYHQNRKRCRGFVHRTCNRNVAGGSQVQPSAMAQFGLNIKEVNKVVNTALQGKVQVKVYEGKTVWFGAFDWTKSKENLKWHSPICLYQRPKALKYLCIKWRRWTSSPVRLRYREDAKRRIVIGFNIRGRDVQSIVNELSKKQSNNYNFHLGITSLTEELWNLNRAKTA